jgi:hypothetical protein
MTKRRREVMIPYKEDGSIPNYTYGFKKYTYKPVEDFNAVLQIVSIGHNVEWQNVLTDATYQMTNYWVNQLISKGEWQGPLLVDGLWRPVKRGTRYLIQPVFPEDVK